jgi:hypothetical protein
MLRVPGVFGVFFGIQELELEHPAGVVVGFGAVERSHLSLYL